MGLEPTYKLYPHRGRVRTIKPGHPAVQPPTGIYRLDARINRNWMNPSATGSARRTHMPTGVHRANLPQCDRKGNKK